MQLVCGSYVDWIIPKLILSNICYLLRIPPKMKSRLVLLPPPSTTVGTTYVR